MSYSTADEKYRKYEGLLRKDPSNTLYKRKLQKYKTLSSKVAQRGGNGSNSNPFAEPVTPIPQPKDNQPKANNPVNSQAKTSDLVNKIHNMLAYAQQNGASMEGGSGSKSGKKKGTGSDGSKKHKTQVKGYRNMVGGVIDFDGDDFDPDTKIATLGITAPAKKLDALTAEQTLAAQKILAGVTGLSTAKGELEQQIVVLKRQLAEAGSEKDRLAEELRVVKEELAALQVAHEQLGTASGSADEQQKLKIQQLMEKVSEHERELEARARKLQEQLEAAELKETQHAAQLEALTLKLEQTKTRANAVIDKMTTQQKTLVSDYDKQAQMYTASMATLKERLAALGVTIAE